MALLLASVAVWLVGEGPTVATPTTAPPRFGVVASVSRETATLNLAQTRSVVVFVGGEPRVIVDVSQVRFSVEGCRFLTAAGKEVTAEAFWQRTKAGQTVLISAHNHKPDPAFLRVLKDDTLVIVEPLPRP